MTEIYLSLSSISEANSNIDDFFDNIPESERDLTNLYTEIANINKAKELLISNLDSTEDDDSENANWEASSMLTITSESIEAEEEIKISQSSSNLTPYALIDIKNGSIQRCSETKNLRGLAQLIGTWQIDDNAVSEAGKELENLGVYRSHFMFDQNCLHEKNAKKGQSIGFISLGNKNLFVPCISYKSCHSLQINEPIITAAKLYQKSRYICCNCFEKNGGHLYIKLGTGKLALQCKMKGNHNEDTKKGSQLISNWIMNLANSDNDLLKAKALSYFTTVIEQLLSTNENENEIYSPVPIILTSHELPSFFIISSLFKLYHINIKDYYYNFQNF
ncbi:hypothetical protein GLOIN_2v1474502 [Rhizophagus clarus]|uniref:Uncharacterized protein n=1 Tax=Rhizophagus clarus TaxID=94130 RepID=A0A8H3LFT1_9GLOM|nr:hypothetical protein GLOIN_2v1474502 [Rhizophagus clarus]